MTLNWHWFARGLRLSLPVGLIAAGWHAWTVFERYSNDRDHWIRIELTYHCAAASSDDVLKAHMNEYGNYNVKSICLTDDDFIVAPYEIEAVRQGTMKFKTSFEPFDWLGTAIAGLLWGLGTIFVTVAAFCVRAVAQWVWGKAS